MLACFACYPAHVVSMGSCLHASPTSNTAAQNPINGLAPLYGPCSQPHTCLLITHRTSLQMKQGCYCNACLPLAHSQCVCEWWDKHKQKSTLSPMRQLIGSAYSQAYDKQVPLCQASLLIRSAA